MTKIIGLYAVTVGLLFTLQAFQFVEQDVVLYYGKDSFLIEGTEIAESLKENPYDRLPASYKDLVRPPVWDLSKSSAGISIRFVTNSSQVAVKWGVRKGATMNHMPATGIRGVDLYVKHNNEWRFVNTAIPGDSITEKTLISEMTPELREFKIFLPLYDGVTFLEVGVDKKSTFTKPTPNTKKPIVFYGTSITQGGCASRPGMAHTNIISRKLDRNCINFGFSGNGRMEEPITELISTIDAEVFIIECLQNMKADMVRERVLPTVKILRKQHPNTPIIFVETTIYENAFLNKTLDNELKEKNVILKNELDKAKKAGFKNIYLISALYATGEDHEGTVDGVHFTDLGFIRYADYLMKELKKRGVR
ncbi:MAG: SGNH/GDSL hydrolase family protein [Cyclobacteriaceae bacterium]|nr:SGNH/GDSL hydrolase family protein [Cyclobacteriaceae bacterium]